jgi:malonate transporter and related proteins
MVSILNSVFPIFAVIALGSILKALRVINDDFIRVSDRLIYYIFFPALLFWKIGKPAKTVSVDENFIAAVLCSVFVVFVLSLVYAKLIGMPDHEVGSFSQGCYRFSTYVGMAVVIADLGEEGVRQFGVLISFVIPFINVLAVSSMVWFSGENHSGKLRTSLLLRSTLSNPLIVACVAGIVFSRFGAPLPVFVDNALGLMSLLALPLALLAIGGSLTCSAFGKHFVHSLTAAAFKLIVMPVVGYGFLHVFHVSGVPYKVAMIYFALPTSPNNYILSALLNSDLSLAVATIVLSTLLSLPALSATLAIFGG